MFDDGFDTSNKENGDAEGTTGGLAIVTTQDREEKEWSEGEEGSRPGSASQHRPGSPSPGPGGGRGGKSPTKRGSPSKGKSADGKGGKLSKGKPAERYERSPRARARSFRCPPTKD